MYDYRLISIKGAEDLAFSLEQKLVQILLDIWERGD